MWYEYNIVLFLGYVSVFLVIMMFKEKWKLMKRNIERMKVK